MEVQHRSGMDDLGIIGEGDDDKKVNHFVCLFVGNQADEAFGGYMPAGFRGRLSKAAALEKLIVAIAERLHVPVASLELAKDGQSLDKSKTSSENGIPDLGPAARKRGEAIELVFGLLQGTELGQAKRDREDETAEHERNREALANAERKRKEDELRCQTERLAQEQKIREEQEHKERDEKQREVNEANSCVIYAKSLGVDDQGTPVRTSLNKTIQEAVVDIKRELGIREGNIMLLLNGVPMEGGATLGDQGVQRTGTELVFFCEGG